MADAAPAARIHDIITHTEAKTGRRIGAGIGAILGIAAGAILAVGAIAALGALEVATGGLATPLVAGAVYVGAGMLAAGTAGMATSAFSNLGADFGRDHATPQGFITTGVVTVRVGTEAMPLAHAFSNASCLLHRKIPPLPPPAFQPDVVNPAQEQIAQGSATVKVGPQGLSVSRVGHLGTCQFKVGQGCNTVIIGGPTVTLAEVKPEDDPEAEFFNKLGEYSGYVAMAGLALVAAPAGLAGMAEALAGAYLVGKVINAGLDLLPPGKLRDSIAAGLTVLPLAGGPKALDAVSKGGLDGLRPELSRAGETPPVEPAPITEPAPAPTEPAPTDPATKTPTDYHPGQQSGNNCAPQSAQQIIHEATGRNLSESEMESLAQSTGKYDPANGTTPGGEADILRAGGVDASEMPQTPENIQRAVDEGKGVITGHDAGQLWPGDPNFVEDPANPVSGGHAVQTTEVIRDADGNVTGYRINDTGTGTAGRIVPADQYHASLDGGPAVVTDAPIRAPREGSVAPPMDDTASPTDPTTTDPRTSGDVANRGAGPERQIPDGGMSISERENVKGATIPDYITDANKNEYYYDTNTGRYTTRPEPTPDFSQGAGNREIPCFPAGTLVRTGSGLEPIEAICAGTLVSSYDEATQAVVLKPVTATWRNQAIRLVEIKTVSETILSTLRHRFWVQSQQMWIEAYCLNEGMTLRNQTGTPERVQSVRVSKVKEQDTFNLTVADCHTYFVGTGSLLVHNEGDDPNGKIYYGYQSGDASKTPIYIGQTKQDLRDREKQHQKEGFDKPDDYAFKQDMNIEQVEGMDGLTDDQMYWHERRVYDEYTNAGYDLQNHQIPMTDEKINELQRQYCE